MSDEQTIYISQEDDLTTIRERLENISSRRVTLVIPSHTQLRSHVAWKLLYARSRELGKEVLIVSSDPQVRSVAHAVKFKVAHSLESSPQGKSRPAGHPTRSANGRSKPQMGKAGTPKNNVRSSTSLQSRQAEPEEEVWYSPTPERRSAIPPSREGTNYQIEDVDGDEITDASISPRYSRTEKPQQSPFEYRVDSPSTLSSIRPVPAEQIEEDADMLTADYEQAQNIREAASRGAKKPEKSEIPSTPDITSRVSPLEHRGSRFRTKSRQFLDEPFVHEEDSQPALAREQRGHATIEDKDTLDAGAEDVADMPTSVLDVGLPESVSGPEIDYHADNDYLPPASEPGTQGSWNRPGTSSREGAPPEILRRAPGTRPKSGRSGYLPPLAPIEGSARGERPASIEDYSTQINPTPFVEPQTSSVSRVGREPDPVQLPAPPRGGARPPDTRGTGRRSADLRGTAEPGGPRSGDLRSRGAALGGPRSDELRNRGATRPAAKTQRPPIGQIVPSIRQPARGARRRRIGSTLLIAALIVLLLALALLIYAVPATQVTLTVAGHNYTHAVALTANPNGSAGTVASRSIVQEFRKKGSEPATGSKMLGTAKSKGFVCFTNQSDASVEIPTGSIVSASNGVQFTTTADGVVLAHNTCVNDPLTFPIEAVKAGETGNVLAGSVTVIPDNSLDSIAKYNKVATSSLKLAVNNSEDIKGGGMQPVPAITDKDLNNAKTDLSNQLKGDIDSWVQNLGKDGVTGNVVTDATLVDAPPKDSTLDNSTTFPAEVAVRATVVFVANSDLQKATLGQLITEIGKDKNYSGYTIAQDAKPPVVISQLKKQVNANSLQLNLNATAQAIPIIPKETVQNIVSGKTPGEARKLLLTNIRGTQDARIQVTPGFFPWVSWWPAHINVTILPGSTTNSPPTHT